MDESGTPKREGTLPRQSDAKAGGQWGGIRGAGDPGYDEATKKLGRYYQPPARDMRISFTQKTFPQLPSDWPAWAQARRGGNAAIGLALFGFAAGTFWYTIRSMSRQEDFKDIKNERRI